VRPGAMVQPPPHSTDLPSGLEGRKQEGSYNRVWWSPQPQTRRENDEVWEQPTTENHKSDSAGAFETG